VSVHKISALSPQQGPQPKLLYITSRSLIAYADGMQTAACYHDATCQVSSRGQLTTPGLCANTAGCTASPPASITTPDSLLQS
jgi:hypothetical protein